MSLPEKVVCWKCHRALSLLSTQREMKLESLMCPFCVVNLAEPVPEPVLTASRIEIVMIGSLDLPFYYRDGKIALGASI